MGSNMVEYDPLETLPRIYLERKGYLVRTNVPADEKELDLLGMKDDEVILGECRANLGYAEGDEELVKCAHFESNRRSRKHIPFRIKGSVTFCFTGNRRR